MNIALVNTNLIKPAIAPIGLEYVAEALLGAGFQVETDPVQVASIGRQIGVTVTQASCR